MRVQTDLSLVYLYQHLYEITVQKFYVISNERWDRYKVISEPRFREYMNWKLHSGR